MLEKRLWTGIIQMTALCLFAGVSCAHASGGQEPEAAFIEGGTLNEAPVIITIKQVQGKEPDLSKTGLLLDFTPNKLIEGQSATRVTEEKACEQRHSMGSAGVPIPIPWFLFPIAWIMEGVDKIDCALTEPVSNLSPIKIRKQAKSITYRKNAPDQWEIAIPLESLQQIPGDYRLVSATFVGGELDGIMVFIGGAASGAHENEPRCYPSFFKGPPNILSVNVNNASPLILIQARHQGKASSPFAFSALTYLPSEDQVYSSQDLVLRSSYNSHRSNRSVAVSSDCSRIVIDPLLDAPSLRPNSSISKELNWRDAWSEYSGKLDDELEDMNEKLSRLQEKRPEAMRLTRGSLKIVQLPEEFFTQKQSGWFDRHRRGRLPALSARMLFEFDKLVAVSVHSFVPINEPALKDDPDGYIVKRKSNLWSYYQGSFLDTNAREKYYFFNRQLHEKMEEGGDHDEDKKPAREHYVLKNGELVAYDDGSNASNAHRSAWYSHLAAVDPAYSHNAPPQTANADLLADQAMWLEAARQYGQVVESPDVKAVFSAAEKGDVKSLRQILSKNPVMANADSAVNDGYTVLMAAVNSGQLEAAKTLLDAGALVNTPATDGSTALYYALGTMGSGRREPTAPAAGTSRTKKIDIRVPVGNRLAVTKLLLAHGAKIEASIAHGETPLLRVAAESNESTFELIKLLLANNADVHATDYDNKNILHRALSTSRPNRALVLYLLPRFPELQTIDQSDVTPMMLAAGNADEIVLKAVLNVENAKQINASDKDGSTALHYAVMARRLKNVELLLAYGARTDMANKAGHSPLLEAQARGFGEIVGAFKAAELKEAAIMAAQAAQAPSRDCPDCPEMVTIPAGRFDMGKTIASRWTEYKDRNIETHRVSLKSFALGKTEITQGQWKAIMGNNPSAFHDCDTCPVEQVSWDDAQAFIQKLNAKTGKQYRLPSEAEWEYACRARGNQKYCGGDELDGIAWYLGNSDQPHPVATKQANAFGLYDMTGNVEEWVEDNYHDTYDGAPTDGAAWLGDDQRRMHRGGSFTDNGGFSYAAERICSSPDYRSSFFGLRVARMLP